MLRLAWMTHLDEESINLLRTICVAGSARPGFDGNSNARLEELNKAGLVDSLENPAHQPTKGKPQRLYRPTEMGRAMLRKLLDEGVA